MVVQDLPGDGMPEAEPLRPEGQGAIPIAAAVFPVAHQGQLAGGKLDPDLVGASGQKPDADQTERLGLRQL